MWAGIAAVVLILAGVIAWIAVPHPGKVGYAQVTASPWAQVVSVKSKQGKDMNLTGQTPLQLELPQGDYVIELKNDQGSGQVDVSVKSGEVVPVNYRFPQVKINDMVDELVAK